MNILLSIGGASGSIYGVRLLEEMVKSGLDVYLIVSNSAKKILEYETEYKYEELVNKVNVCYNNDDLFAAPASGSFHLDGMVIAPCSMKTLSAIAN